MTAPSALRGGASHWPLGRAQRDGWYCLVGERWGLWFTRGSEEANDGFWVRVLGAGAFL